VDNLKQQKKISGEEYVELRKKIKQNTFKDIRHLKGETK
jgi:ribosomal protein L19E